MKFEAAVFNQHVRDAVKQLEHHPNYKDEWADLHYIEVKADNMVEARKEIERQFPKSKGFVMDNIIALPEFD